MRPKFSVNGVVFLVVRLGLALGFVIGIMLLSASGVFGDLRAWVRHWPPEEVRPKLLAPTGDLDRAADILGAKLGRHLPKAPLARPDGKAYALSGKLRKIDGNKLRVAIAPPRVVAALADETDEAEFLAVIPEALMPHFEASAKLDGEVEMVGLYTANVARNPEDPGAGAIPEFELQWIRPR